jgi:hypothetical protein
MVDLLVNDFNRTLSEFSLVVEVYSRANRRRGMDRLGLLTRRIALRRKIQFRPYRLADRESLHGPTTRQDADDEQPPSELVVGVGRSGAGEAFSPRVGHRDAEGGGGEGRLDAEEAVS